MHNAKVSGAGGIIACVRVDGWVSRLVTTKEGVDMQLDLANGWTLSIVPDLTDRFYSIAAWQTSDNNPVAAIDRKWFGFEGGAIECRTADIAEFLEAAAQVMKTANV